MDYLARVIDALKKQSLPKTNWELLVIDNGSEKPLSRSLDLSWHPTARVIREDALGIAYARIRGIRESASEILVFVDDDNVLDSGYLENCLRIAAEWPQLGIWGGSILPEFEIEPPSGIVPYLKILALREVNQPLWSNVRTCTDAEPWGAGLCVRLSAAQAYIESFSKTKFPIAGNTGNLLLGGDDTEMCYTVCNSGLGMGLFPDLKLTHLISKRRLSEDYIVRIKHGYAVKSLLLAYKWGGVHPTSAFSPIEILRFLKQMISIRSLQRRLAWAFYRARITATKIIAGEEHSMAVDWRQPPPSFSLPEVGD